MAVRSIRTIGDPVLHARVEEVAPGEPRLAGWVADLADTLVEFRKRHGFGRGIAAPQIGISHRIVVLHFGAEPIALVNPEIVERSAETFTLWDDCLSVPDSIVRVRRARSISIRYTDARGRERLWRELPPDLSELVQHEVDHLDGVLMTDRAIDAQSVRPLAERESLIDDVRPRSRLSLERIARAAGAIEPCFRGTPQYECESLAESLGCRLVLKVETANPIRSFKGRGADQLLRALHERGDDRRLVCASAGNFGQAMAYVCRSRGRPLVVYAAENANSLKVDRMRSLGAEVRLAGRDFDAAKEEARRAAEVAGALFVEDGAQREIAEGAATIAVELFSDSPVIDALLVPLGNGALLGGIARWTKAVSPPTRTLGVVSRGADAMERSFRAGRPVETRTAETIADGIAVRVPVPEAVEDLARDVDDIVAVSDDSIRRAMRSLYRTAGLVVEPAGAVGVAAILESPQRFSGRRVATVLCGSNVSEEQARRWLAY